MTRRSTEPAAVRNAFAVGKPRKKILKPRAEAIGYLKPTRERDVKVNQRHRAAVERGLEIVAEGKVVDAKELYSEHLKAAAAEGLVPMITDGRGELRQNPVARQRYAALETARELAALKMGAGGTFEEAADEAGVSAATVKKWLEVPEFLERVNELRAIRKLTVGARIEAWMERRTSDPDVLDASDPKVTLAIYDRIAPITRGSVHAEQNNLTVNDYTGLMGRLAGIAAQSASPGDVADPGAQGGAFPTVGVERPAVAGDVPPGHAPLSGGGPGETSG